MECTGRLTGRFTFWKIFSLCKLLLFYQKNSIYEGTLLFYKIGYETLKNMDIQCYFSISS